MRTYLADHLSKHDRIWSFRSGHERRRVCGIRSGRGGIRCESGELSFNGRYGLAGNAEGGDRGRGGG